jgi:hypothetical protein
MITPYPHPLIESFVKEYIINVVVQAFDKKIIHDRLQTNDKTTTTVNSKERSPPKRIM